MKESGEIANFLVVVMINSGASHNFILEGLLERLQLWTEPMIRFAVRLGNGRSKIAQGAVNLYFLS